MSSTPLDARALWADLQAVREHAPLVHSITNLVVMNYNANALLDALDDLDASRLSDEQLDRLAQIVEALAIEIDQEYMRRDTGEESVTA